MRWQGGKGLRGLGRLHPSYPGLVSLFAQHNPATSGSFARVPYNSPAGLKHHLLSASILLGEFPLTGDVSRGQSVFCFSSTWGWPTLVSGSKPAAGARLCGRPWSAHPPAKGGALFCPESVLVLEGAPLRMGRPSKKWVSPGAPHKTHTKVTEWGGGADLSEVRIGLDRTLALVPTCQLFSH